MRTLKAGLTYFILFFAVGWVLGPTWEFWAVPHLGRTVGMLVEAPLMLAAAICLLCGDARPHRASIVRKSWTHLIHVNGVNMQAQYALKYQLRPRSLL